MKMKRKSGFKKKTLRVMKKSVRLASTSGVDPSALGTLAGYGDAAKNGAVGSWSRAKGNAPFSDRFFCKDRWSAQFGATQPNGTVPPWTAIAFRSNSLFDPNFLTGIGQTSSQYFLTLGQIYLQYRVHASSIHLEMDQSGVSVSTDASDIVVGVWPSLVPPTATLLMPQSLQAMRLQSNVHCKEIGPTYAGQSPSLKHYMKIGDLVGVQNLADDPNFTGLFTNSLTSQGGTNPPNTIYWLVQAWFTTGVAVPADQLNIGCTIKYDVECFNLVPDVNASPTYTEDFEHMYVIYSSGISTLISAGTA